MKSPLQWIVNTVYKEYVADINTAFVKGMRAASEFEALGIDNPTPYIQTAIYLTRAGYDPNDDDTNQLLVNAIRLTAHRLSNAELDDAIKHIYATRSRHDHYDH